MDDNFQKSIIPIDDEEETKIQELTTGSPSTPSEATNYTGYSDSSFLVYTSHEGNKYYIDKADAISPF